MGVWGVWVGGVVEHVTTVSIWLFVFVINLVENFLIIMLLVTFSFIVKILLEIRVPNFFFIMLLVICILIVRLFIENWKPSSFLLVCLFIFDCYFFLLFVPFSFIVMFLITI